MSMVARTVKDDLLSLVKSLECWGAMPATERAVIFALAKHGAQKYTPDTTGIPEPYIEHLLRIANTVEDETNDEVATVAAILRDVLEDTDASLVQINELFGAPVGLLVAMLTCRRGEDYDAYLHTLQDPTARAIERADARDDRDHSEPGSKRWNRYNYVMELLKEPPCLRETENDPHRIVECLRANL